MVHKGTLACAWAISAMSIGCASTQTIMQLDDAKWAAIIEGKTTEAELVASLGPAMGKGNAELVSEDNLATGAMPKLCGNPGDLVVDLTWFSSRSSVTLISSSTFRELWNITMTKDNVVCRKVRNQTAQ